MRAIKKVLACLLFLLASVSAFTQETGMADTMRSNGKIYVVVAVVLTILIGLILYVVRVDRKITRLEREDRTMGNGQ